MFKYIADTPTVAIIAGADDITRFLRPLIFTTLLEVHGFLKAFSNCRYTPVFTFSRHDPKPQDVDGYKK
jgi:hypothetical protein